MNSRCGCRWWSAPRYNPAPLVQSVDLRADGGGWGATTTDPVPDRDRISPTVLDPAEHAPVNPTAITVRLQAGFPLGEVKSHHHQVKIESPDSTTRIITLAEGLVPADRDFELTWKPAAEKAPSVGLFREHVGDADYLLAFVTPPSVEQAQQKPLPREVIFVIDNSGSMGGTSIVQAKASLTLRARPAAAERPLQCDPLRSHHGRAVSELRAGRRAARRQCHGVRRRAARRRRHGNDAGDARGADRFLNRRCQLRSPGGVPDRRRDRQRAAIVRNHHRDARPLAHLHGRHRLGAEHLPDDARRRTRPRRLHPYRLGRAGRGADARPVRQAGKSRR